MPTHGYRALVVDDEAAVRMITMRELSRNGFTCDAAHDGIHAKELLSDNRYDAVVTDLRMPQMNGHALAVELLDRPNPPVVVVLTGVTEPRLAKDLIARGVDDILFKPIDQSILASKVRALVDRRASQASPSLRRPQSAEVPESTGLSAGLGPVDADELDARVSQLVEIAPISQAALDVVRMAASETLQTRQLAAVIELDGAFAAEVLRIANSPVFNPTARAARGIEEAVLRLGQKRTGELALAISAMTALQPKTLSSLDVSLLWQRSLAAGVVADLLVTKGGHSAIGAGLYLSSIMHLLGRIALSSLFPDRYEEMLRLSQESGLPLQEYERRLFRRTHSDVLSQILEGWGIPAAISDSLYYAQSPQSDVAALQEPLRTRIDLLQLAIVLSRWVIGRWNPWDVVRIPPDEASCRLGIESLDDVVELARLELDATSRLSDFEATKILRTAHTASAESAQEVFYCNLARAALLDRCAFPQGRDSFDFVGALMSSIGLRPRPCILEDLSPGQPAVVNCLGLTMDEVRAKFTPSTHHLLVSDSQGFTDLRPAELLLFPTSFGIARSKLLTLTGHCSAS